MNLSAKHALTVSIFREKKPVKLMKELDGYGCAINEYAPGIYYIDGLMISVQIIATRELTSELHASLKVLTDKLEKIDFLNFMEYTNSFTEPSDKRNVDAVLQVSISANKNMYDQIRRSDPTMCDALRELFKDELEEAHESGLTEGRTEGKIEEISRLKDLYSRLEQDGRREELFQALSNSEVLAKLYREYGLE